MRDQYEAADLSEPGGRAWLLLWRCALRPQFRIESFEHYDSIAAVHLLKICPTKPGLVIVVPAPAASDSSPLVMSGPLQLLTGMPCSGHCACRPGDQEEMKKGNNATS